MSELRYQLDLLKAMNQRLSGREKMYRFVCETSYSAFIYYSFEKKEMEILGKWDSFFDFKMKDLQDIHRLFEAIDRQFEISLREVLFAEKEGKEEAVCECMLRGKKRWLEFRTCVSYDMQGLPEEKIVCISDITKHKLQNEELMYMAYYDTLTGLYNRDYFVRCLGEFLRSAEAENRIVSVLAIDIDDFHKVNDGLGIIAGDELVQQFGSVLKDLCSEKIIAGHFNSDYYCLAIYDSTGERTVKTIYEKLQNALKTPFLLSSGQELTITVSVGVAEYPEATVNTLELINCAEIVMYKGKDLGKNTIQYFDEPILKEFLQNVQIETKLKEAVFNHYFTLHFQPQFYVGNKKLRGVEALIRWRDRDGQMISPAVFIPVAEKNGTIIPIGNWVMEEAISNYSRWRKRYGYSFILSINISAIQYAREDFVPNLMNVLNKYSVNPSEIELEVTESVLIEDFQKVTEKLKILRGYGIKVSLDDFGTGYSSLSYLKKLPIDTLKIDKTFVDTVLTDPATRAIMEFIISMVKTLGLETIAEGVEQEQQFKYLHAIGCNVIQGYYLSRPLSVDALEKLLEESVG